MTRACSDRSELAARLALLVVPKLPAERVIPLVERYGSAIAALNALHHEFDPGVAAAAKSDEVRERVRRVRHAVEVQQIGVLAFDDDDYPARLREGLGAGAPPLLFTLGDTALLSLRCIAVVGSRAASEYGLDVAAQVGGGVARAGGCVVSGLALGIDAAAHEAALDAGGATIGVLGCGVDVTYPRRNSGLQSRVAQHGLLISELLPGEPPRAYQFPHRNRIIVALSEAVVVVEARAQSGALATAVHAMEQGIPLFAVPNRLDEPGMQGIVGLYRDGVAPFTGVRDLLESTGLMMLGGTLPSADEEAGPAGSAAAAIWGVLGSRPAHVDLITRRSGLTSAEALTTLLELELDGRVRQLPGGRFQRLKPPGPLHPSRTSASAR